MTQRGPFDEAAMSHPRGPRVQGRRGSLYAVEVRLLAVLLALTLLPAQGCKRDDDDEEEVPKKKKKKKSKPAPSGDPVAIADAGPEASDLGPKAKALPEGDLLAPSEAALLKAADGGFALYVENETPIFKFGRAQFSYGSLHVTLSTEKIGCAWATPGDEAYQVDFDLAPGPGGTYYAGHAIGTQVTWNSSRLKLRQLSAGPHQTRLSVDPFVAKDGEHIKGTLAFDAATKIVRPDGTRVDYEYRGRGAFDVSICPSYSGSMTGLDPLSPTAGLGPVKGTYGGRAFTAASALAFVQKDWTTGAAYLESIEFYAAPTAGCSDRWTLASSTDHLVARAIGGSGTKFTVTGPQPMEPAFSVPKTSGGLGYPRWFGTYQRRGWIKLDALDLKSGATVTGELVAESAPGSKADETGKMSGHFTAKVCGGL